jgi:hypothetical protein
MYLITFGGHRPPLQEEEGKNVAAAMFDFLPDLFRLAFVPAGSVSLVLIERRKAVNDPFGRILPPT